MRVGPEWTLGAAAKGARIARLFVEDESPELASSPVQAQSATPIFKNPGAALKQMKRYPKAHQRSSSPRHLQSRFALCRTTLVRATSNKDVLLWSGLFQGSAASLHASAVEETRMVRQRDRLAATPLHVPLHRAMPGRLSPGRSVPSTMNARDGQLCSSALRSHSNSDCVGAGAVLPLLPSP